MQLFVDKSRQQKNNMKKNLVMIAEYLNKVNT